MSDDRLAGCSRVEEEVHDAIDVVGEAGVVERRRERVSRAAAVAHVHADDVAAGAPELVGVADDVLRVARSLRGRAG